MHFCTAFTLAPYCLSCLPAYLCVTIWNWWLRMLCRQLIWVIIAILILFPLTTTHYFGYVIYQSLLALSSEFFQILTTKQSFRHSTTLPALEFVKWNFGLCVRKQIFSSRIIIFKGLIVPSNICDFSLILFYFTFSYTLRLLSAEFIYI